MFRFNGRAYVQGCLGGGDAGLTETARMHATTVRSRQILHTIPTVGGQNIAPVLFCYFHYDMHRVEPTPLPLPETYNIGPTRKH